MEVTPFVGVWIETQERKEAASSGYVTPFVGVWIETLLMKWITQHPRSHPSWVCGLKLWLLKKL